MVTHATDNVDGCLYVKNGTVIAASNGEQVGVDAAATMVAWEDTTVTIYSLPTHITINVPSDLIARLVHDHPRRIDTTLGLGASVGAHPLVTEAPAVSALLEPIAEEPLSSIAEHQEAATMALNDTLKQVMEIDGATNVAIVDWTSGMAFGSLGNGLNVELAAAGNANVIRAKAKVIKDLGLKDRIEDILITLGEQYHFIRVLESNPNLFLYVILSRNQANLAMARYRLTQVEHGLVV